MLPRSPSRRCVWIRRWRRLIACAMCLLSSDTAPARCVIAGKTVRVLDAAAADVSLGEVRFSFRLSVFTLAFRWLG